MKARNRAVGTLFFVVFGLMACSASASADTGSVTVLFSKGGFIVGVGTGEGVLTFKGRHYPFTVTGMSLGATVGASTSKLVGRALNLRGPRSIEGVYNSVGAGGALVGGAGGAELENANGVILQLRGPKVGAELSVALGGVRIKLK